MSTALDKLLSRTLKQGPRRKDTRSQRRQKKEQHLKAKLESEAQDALRQAEKAAKRRKKQQARIAALVENENHGRRMQIKSQIIEKLAERPVYVKRQTALRTWAGLTPGLAPVDYNPDESSDEEPSAFD